MRRFLAAMFLVFSMALLPVAASADEGKSSTNDFLFKADGAITVTSDQSIGTLVAVSSMVQIDGVVKNLVVIDGDVTVNGSVANRITVIDGRLNLGPTAQVNNIDRVAGTFTRADGAVILGHVEERSRLNLDGIGYIFGVIMWVAFTLVVLSAGLAFALLGGRQLKQTANMMSGRPAEGFAAGLIFGIAAPVAGIALMLTIVGIPLGLAVLLLVLPAAFLLGYTVAAYKLGSFLAARIGKGSDHTVLPTLAGLVILQAIVILPVAGVIIAGIAATLGAGALLLSIAGSMHHDGNTPPVTPGLAA